MFRHEPTGNYLAIDYLHVFWMWPDNGTFGIRRWRGARTTLQPATASAAIRRGAATNRLRVECRVARIAAGVNGVPLGEVDDAGIGSGWIGLSAAGAGMDARFDNLAR